MTAEVPQIVPVNIEDEIRHCYLDYAMSVIIGRALPDVRDGLKPVHRRILFAMHELGNRWNSSYKKSARVVGDVIGKYHPHGDSAVYDALVRLAQDFNMRQRLVDGQGNFGSVDGDPAAAMRYTEVRMARITQELLNDIEKNTIDWGPNYDDSMREPLVLPSRVPNLLVNGSSGIAVGMSTNIPPHNLREVIDAIVALIDRPSISAEEIMEIIPGPDFPTGGIIYGGSGIRDAYTTGRGVIRIRAKTHFEEDERRGKVSIIVDELPFQVNKARLLEKIAGLVRDKKIEGITDLRDESDRDGMRMVVELRRDVMPEIILNNLFKMTALQSSFGIINLAIVHGQPKIMPIREILGYFVDFRRDVTTRRTVYELEQAEARAHILEGLKIALDNLDEVIALIRASSDVASARAGLMTTFALSERQAQAILDMRLQKLTGLERNKILEELAEIRAEIERLRGILSDDEKLMALIKDEIVAVREQYGSDRKTEITYDVSEIGIEDLIPEETVAVTLSHQGYIKRTAIDDYRSQRRGGKGRRGMATKDEDFVVDMFVGSTHTFILVLTSIGKVYKRKVHQLPVGSPSTKGRPIVQILPMREGETVKAILAFEDFSEDQFVVTATRGGIVKKTALSSYRNVHAGGIIALGLKEGDELVAARLCQEDDWIFLASRAGQSIRFKQSDIRSMGRGAAGVFGMRFREDDTLVSMDIIPSAHEELMLLSLTTRGYGKRTDIEEYSVQGRGGTGNITIKTTDKTGTLVGAMLVSEDDELLIITDGGQIIRTSVAQVSSYGRNTQGVRIMNASADEAIVGIARIHAEHLLPEEESTEAYDDGSSANVSGEAVQGDEEGGSVSASDEVVPSAEESGSDEE
jgi:DNA gyrase subunit A